MAWCSLPWSGSLYEIATLSLCSISSGRGYCHSVNVLLAQHWRMIRWRIEVIFLSTTVTCYWIKMYIGFVTSRFYISCTVISATQERIQFTLHGPSLITGHLGDKMTIPQKWNTQRLQYIIEAYNHLTASTIAHCSDVTWASWRLKSPILQQFIQSDTK